MTTDRIHCCIPACRRSFKRKADEADDCEIMCGRCWRTTDPKLRARYKVLHARSRRVFSLSRRKAIKEKRGFAIQFDMLHGLFMAAHARVWAAIKADAEFKSNMRIEGTAGDLAHRRKHGR